MNALLARFRANPLLKRGAIGGGALAGVGLMLYLATGDPASSDSLPALAAQMLSKTALVLGLLFLTLAGLKRWQTGAVRTKQLSVIETLRLSPRQSLHLVRVGGRHLLIGASEAQVSLLTEVAEPPAGDPAAPSSAFARLLEQPQRQPQ